MIVSESKEKSAALTPVPSKSWGVLILVLLAGIAVPLNMFKCPGLAGTLMGYFDITASDFGWLQSVYTIMGIVLAFPAAGIMSRIGEKNTILVSLAFTVIGCLVGAFANSYTILLVGRFLEGVSMGLITVAAPAAISKWFPGHKRGLALGIWSPWVPIGNIIMLNLSNPIANAFGGSWQAVWYVGAAYAVVMFVLLALLYKEPSAPILDPDEQLSENEPAGGKILDKNGKNPFANAAIWLLALGFLFFNLTQNGTLNTFYTTFLMEEHSFTQSSAAFVTSFITILAIPGCIFAGWLADKMGSKRWLIIIGFVGALIGGLLYFTFTDVWQMWVAVTIGGLIGCFVTTGVFAASPEIMGPKANGIGMAIIGFMSNVGQFIGGIAMGYLYVPLGWATASYVLFVPLLVLGALCVFFTRKQLR